MWWKREKWYSRYAKDSLEYGAQWKLPVKQCILFVRGEGRGRLGNEAVVKRSMKERIF